VRDAHNGLNVWFASRDRGFRISSCDRPAELDLAADLAAGRVVSLHEDGVAERVERHAALVVPDDDITAIVESGDLAVDLVSGSRGVGLGRCFPKMGGRGHGVLPKRIVGREGSHRLSGAAAVFKATLLPAPELPSFAFSAFVVRSIASFLRRSRAWSPDPTSAL
jgi:hypothetical protein